MLFNHHDSLRKVYFRSFAVLIVVPLLLVFGAAMGVLGVMMRNSAVETIRTFQDNVVTALSEDIREASLQLSHFVFVNDGEFMKTAAGMDTDDPGVRYRNGELLDQAFQTAMVPNQDIVAGKFYMKDGRSVYMKDEIILPEEEVKRESWYQEALSHPNQVKIGCYDTTGTRLTYSRQKTKEFVIVTAMAPDASTDRSGKVELASFYTMSAAGDVIRTQEKNEMLGRTIILDENGRVLYGAFADRALEAFFRTKKEKGSLLQAGVRTEEADPSGQGGNENYTFVVSGIPETRWRAVSFVRTSLLTQEFNRVAAVLVVVICMLLTFFYLFSMYFLRNIIHPVHTMVEGLREVEQGNLDTHIEPQGQSEIRTMLHSFNRMVRQMKTSLAQKEEAQKKKHEAEVKALQSQINPHFLVNTLNSIRFMAQVSKFDGIRRMAEALIRIVSCSFRSNISFYTVREELDVLDSYLYLMKIRYSEGFEAEYRVDGDCLDYRIPRLVLQPIVENSIVHGFTDLEEEIGRLLICVSKDDRFLYLEVEDNGRGMTEEEIDAILNRRQRNEDDNYSIGVQNVFTRLKLNFGTDCSMRMESEPGKFTRTVIRLPLLGPEPELTLQKETGAGRETAAAAGTESGRAAASQAAGGSKSERAAASPQSAAGAASERAAASPQAAGGPKSERAAASPQAAGGSKSERAAASPQAAAGAVSERAAASPQAAVGLGPDTGAERGGAPYEQGGDRR